MEPEQSAFAQRYALMSPQEQRLWNPQGGRVSNPILKSAFKRPENAPAPKKGFGFRAKADELKSAAEPEIMNTWMSINNPWAVQKLWAKQNYVQQKPPTAQQRTNYMTKYAVPGDAWTAANANVGGAFVYNDPRDIVEAYRVIWNSLGYPDNLLTYDAAQSKYIHTTSFNSRTGAPIAYGKSVLKKLVKANSISADDALILRSMPPHRFAIAYNQIVSGARQLQRCVADPHAWFQNYMLRREKREKKKGRRWLMTKLKKYNISATSQADAIEKVSGIWNQRKQEISTKLAQVAQRNMQKWDNQFLEGIVLAENA